MDKVIVSRELLEEVLICLQSDGHQGGNQRCDACNAVDRLRRIVEPTEVFH